jgi:hypothetical protein
VKLATYHYLFADSLPSGGLPWRMHCYLRQRQPNDIVTYISTFQVRIGVTSYKWSIRGAIKCKGVSGVVTSLRVDAEYHAFFVCGASYHIRAQRPFSEVLTHF